MSYVLLLYSINKYQKDWIAKAIGPFDTEDEAMSRPEIHDRATYTGAVVVPVIPPEEA